MKPRAWKVYFSHRLWVLFALFGALSALALIQYRWIDQLAKAQRRRTRANLSTALSNVESDFDMEVTRAFLAFQYPGPGISCADRYQEWLRHAPYPHLVRGVYVVDAERASSLPKPVVAQEPPVREVGWHRDFRKLAFPLGAVTASGVGPVGFQVFSTRGGSGAMLSVGPWITVDGNPALAFPALLPAPRLASRVIVRAPGKEGPFQEAQIVSSGGRVGPPQWVLVVFDAHYMRSTFLPALVRRYVRSSSASGFDVIAVDRSRARSSKMVFPAPSGSVPNKFAKPDGKVALFQLRIDCFSRSSSTVPAAVAVRAGRSLGVVSLERLSGILARKSTACSNPAPSTGSHVAGTWELLAKYRAGSLDQAIATFRRRNLFVSGSMLLVLALGVSLAVLLAERARALAEMQADFILGVSHELRTPLTVIRVAADNLRKGIVENSSKAHSYGEIIHTQAVELSNMIEETLMVARMRSEVIRRRSSVPPERIVKRALADNDFALRDAGIRVDLDVAPGLPDVDVDFHLIKRCVGNLIQNATKYAVAGGQVAIRARTAIRHNRPMVEMAVEDSGPGISKEDLPHIFEPFYRGKRKDTSQIAGIGLGLTLVQRAVEAHGGLVEVDSGETTRFSIFLPAQDTQPSGHQYV